MNSSDEVVKESRRPKYDLGPVLVIGAGPAGLGAAHCLEELGADWLLLEKDDGPGGLSRSFLDEEGYTWDLGGHVVFSHYDRVTTMLDELLPEAEWLRHERVSMVRYGQGWIPYPFQRNVHRLPVEEREACMEGLREAARKGERPHGADFETYSRAIFGDGVVDCFLRPYNWKVWAIDPRELDSDWIEDRVSPPDLERLEDCARRNVDDVGWGPNNCFSFPRQGGTGRIWEESLRRLPRARIRMSSPVVAVDLAKKEVRTAEGERFPYARLLSTMPLKALAEATGRGDLQEGAKGLRSSAVHVVGVGMKGQMPPERDAYCWMYFPEDTTPFYRVTHFSHYSPWNVPRATVHGSLMAEISESSDKAVDGDRVVEETVKGLVAAGLITSPDEVVHRWHRRIPLAYPTPVRGHRAVVDALLPELQKAGVWSRGRFGSWVYEVGNMDHCYMQGREAILNMAFGSPELTLWEPNVVNRKHPVLGWGRSR